MHGTRTIWMFLGVALVIGGGLLLYVEAGLQRWISLSILVAGLLVFVGVAVMSFATSAPAEHHTGSSGDSTVVVDHDKDPD